MPVVNGLQKENWLQHPEANELPVFTLLFSSKTFNNAEAGKLTTMSHLRRAKATQQPENIEFKNQMAGSKLKKLSTLSLV